MACPIIRTLNISHEIIQSSALIQTSALCKFTLDDCRERLLNSLLLLAGLGGFAAFLALLDGSYAHCGTVTVPICSTDAAITGRKRFDCRCISTICLVFLKTKHDDKTAVGYTAVFPFQIAFKKP